MPSAARSPAIGALDDLLWATAYQIASMLKVAVGSAAAGQGGRRLEVASGYPPEDRLDDADMAAARWSWEHNRPAGRGADTLPGGKRLFLPLRTGSGPVGVLGIDRDAPGPLLTPDERRLLDALATRRRSPSSGSRWPRGSTRRACWPRPSGCARRC